MHINNWNLLPLIDFYVTAIIVEAICEIICKLLSLLLVSSYYNAPFACWAKINKLAGKLHALKLMLHFHGNWDWLIKINPNVLFFKFLSRFLIFFFLHNFFLPSGMYYFVQSKKLAKRWRVGGKRFFATKPQKTLISKKKSFWQFTRPIKKPKWLTLSYQRLPSRTTKSPTTQFSKVTLPPIYQFTIMQKENMSFKFTCFLCSQAKVALLRKFYSGQPYFAV